MGLKPDHIANQKQAAEDALAARQAHLRAKGLDDRALARDPLIKKTKAAIRQAIGRQGRVTALDKQSAERVQAKADKAAGKTEAKPKKDKGAQEGGEKKKKKKKEKKEKDA